VIASRCVSYLWLHALWTPPHLLAIADRHHPLTGWFLDTWHGDLAVDPLPTNVMCILVLHDSLYRGCVGEGHETETSGFPTEFVKDDHALVNGTEFLKEGLEFGLSDILRQPSDKDFSALPL